LYFSYNPTSILISGFHGFFGKENYNIGVNYFPAWINEKNECWNPP
jgi:hypothetical protein